VLEAISTKGYKYGDKTLSADGIQKIVGKGGDPGKGSIQAKGKNNAAKGQTALPTGIAALLASDTKATVQILTDDAACFTGTATTVQKADGLVFKAKAPAGCGFRPCVGCELGRGPSSARARPRRAPPWRAQHHWRHPEPAALAIDALGERRVRRPGEEPGDLIEPRGPFRLTEGRRAGRRAGQTAGRGEGQLARLKYLPVEAPACRLLMHG